MKAQRQSLRLNNALRRPKDEAAYWASESGASSHGVLRIERHPRRRRPRAVCVAWGFPTHEEADGLAALGNLLAYKAGGGGGGDDNMPVTTYVAIKRPPCLIQCPCEARALRIPANFPLGTNLAALDKLETLFSAHFLRPFESEVEATRKKLTKALNATRSLRAKRPAERAKLVQKTVDYILLNSESLSETPPDFLDDAQWQEVESAAAPVHAAFVAATADLHLDVFGPTLSHLVKRATLLSLTLPRSMAEAAQNATLLPLPFEEPSPDTMDDSADGADAADDADDDAVYARGVRRSRDSHSDSDSDSDSDNASESDGESAISDVDVSDDDD